MEAQRKRRSRGTKTPDNVPPKDSRSTAEKPPDIDLDIDPDNDSDPDRLNTSVALAILEPQTPTPDRPPQAVVQVFDAWLVATGRTNQTLLDAKRRRLIDKALKAYPLEDVLDAVRGWQRSPHHRGENDTRTVYNDLELLLRDAAHIERFRDLERQAPSTNGVVPLSENMRLLQSMRSGA